MKKNRLNPVTPGDVLMHEFLEPLNITKNKAATEIGVTASRIGEIVNGTRAITADTALRLSKLFGTTPEFWMNLQTSFDLEIARDQFEDELDNIHTVAA